MNILNDIHKNILLSHCVPEYFLLELKCSLLHKYVLVYYSTLLNCQSEWLSHLLHLPPTLESPSNLPASFSLAPSLSVCPPANPAAVMLSLNRQSGARPVASLASRKSTGGGVSSVRCEESMCALAQNGAQPRRAPAAVQWAHGMFLFPPNTSAKMHFIRHTVKCGP